VLQEQQILCLLPFELHVNLTLACFAKKLPAVLVCPLGVPEDAAGPITEPRRADPAAMMRPGSVILRPGADGSAEWNPTSEPNSGHVTILLQQCINMRSHSCQRLAFTPIGSPNSFNRPSALYTFSSASAMPSAATFTARA
jgi:hypothetical protein